MTYAYNCTLFMCPLFIPNLPVVVYGYINMAMDNMCVSSDQRLLYFSHSINPLSGVWW